MTLKALIKSKIIDEYEYITFVVNSDPKNSIVKIWLSYLEGENVEFCKHLSTCSNTTECNNYSIFKFKDLENSNITDLGIVNFDNALSSVLQINLDYVKD